MKLSSLSLFSGAGGMDIGVEPEQAAPLEVGGKV